MPVTTTISSGHTSGAQTSLTIAHTSDTRPLYVLLSWFVALAGIEAANIITGITFGGVSLTRGGQRAVAGNTHEWWRLIGPAVGAHNLVITASGARMISAAVLNLSGWPDLVADHEFEGVGAINQSSISLNIDSGVHAEVIDWLGYNSPNITQVTAPTAGQSQLWDQDLLDFPANDQKSSGSLKAGASSVTMSWSLGDNTETTGLAAISWVPPVAASAPVNYEQEAAIAEPRVLEHFTHTIHVGHEIVRLAMPMQPRQAPRVRRR